MQQQKTVRQQPPAARPHTPNTLAITSNGISVLFTEADIPIEERNKPPYGGLSATGVWKRLEPLFGFAPIQTVAKVPEAEGLYRNMVRATIEHGTLQNPSDLTLKRYVYMNADLYMDIYFTIRNKTPEEQKKIQRALQQDCREPALRQQLAALSIQVQQERLPSPAPSSAAVAAPRVPFSQRRRSLHVDVGAPTDDLYHRAYREREGNTPLGSQRLSRS